MDTLRVLDSYRTVVFHDSVNFRILSHLFIEGPLGTDDAIPPGMQPSDYRSRVTSLYRANLIRHAGPSDDRWATTSFANAILARAGLARTAIKWLIDDFDLSPSDSQFLHACVNKVDASEEDDPLIGLQRHWLVKSLALAKASLPDDQLSRQDARDAIYAAIVGTDSRAEALGPEGFVILVLGHAYAESRLASFIPRCESAIDRARRSTRLLVADTCEWDDSCMMLSWARLLSALICGIPDESLSSVHSETMVHLADTWRHLDRWRNVSDASRRIFREVGAGEIVSSKSEFAATLLAKMAFVSRSSMYLTTNFDPLIEAAFRFAGESDCVNRVIGAIRRLEDTLRSGELEFASDSEKAVVCEAIGRVAEAYQAKLGPSAQSPGEDR